MVLRDILSTCIIALLCTPCIFLLTTVGYAQVMQSPSYRIESDSINFSGGLSSSTNYVLESTAGEVATGDSASTNYGLKAGYQQMVTTLISMSAPDSVTMTPSIPGVTGGTANGSTTVTVTTDSSAGYALSIKSSQSPALVSGVNTISDYDAGADPDYSFGVSAGDSHFGYSPSGVDVHSRFKDDGVSICNTGSSDTLLACWDGLHTSDETIAQRASANTPDGATTTVYFRVGIGGSVSQGEGTYTATTTLTAIAL